MYATVAAAEDDFGPDGKRIRPGITSTIITELTECNAMLSGQRKKRQVLGYFWVKCCFQEKLIPSSFKFVKKSFSTSLILVKRQKYMISECFFGERWNSSFVLQQISIIENAFACLQLPFNLSSSVFIYIYLRFLKH